MSEGKKYDYPLKLHYSQTHAESILCRDTYDYPLKLTLLSNRIGAGRRKSHV